MSVFRPLRRYFLPSRTMGYYIARVFLLRFFSLAIGVAVVLQMLDLLTQSDAILAAQDNGNEALWRYIFLRFPDLLSRFIPFSALLAVLLTLATLAQHSEIVVMKASGMSAHRILLPLVLTCGAIALFHFFLDQKLVAPATAELDYWKRFDYAADLPPPPDVLDDLWLTEGSSLVQVKAVSRSRNLVILDKVTVYERDKQGMVSGILRAGFAWHSDGVWTLYAVRRFDVATHAITTAESMPWALTAPPERFFSLSVVPEQSSFGSLSDSIAQLEKEGQKVTALKAALLHKIAGPAATLLMPILGAIAGFGAQRRGKIFARIAMGMGLGFAFFVADNFMLAMGKFGAAPPFLSAFGAMIFFAAVGLAVIFRIEE
ncbi:LPS export ABC transporter permease LptG [Iodidimonas muriae]|uniref:LPS export ABC transporter permease LptG n=1 Tax=Iodidimonas muriae TaxID=261467 RepID=A0ABQ2LG18_9PROT|nr:LPS export ABC transporter permease LptG [Iodidimonas muriae]GER08560.1 LPS export ABC transporter permease LptG [Kordiimonadales bacterium JCM 17843]GGO16557.1 LPS export ABC transporter permease LptG [Iodidimonas muriae]